MKTTHVIISPVADRELRDIWSTIAIDNPSAATRLIRTISKKIALLAQYPRMGRRRPEIRPPVRVLIAKSYIILYETAPDTDNGLIKTVEIVRVVHGRRDLMRLY